MYAQIITNDVFHTGPWGHPAGASEYPLSRERLREILDTHQFFWGVGGEPHGWLRGPDYRGVTVREIDPETAAMIAAHPSMAGRRFGDPQC